MPRKRVKLEDWTTEDNLAVLISWCRAGLSYREIAKNIGISRNTLHRWRDLSPKLAETLSTSKDMADALVENALYKSALGFTYEEQVVTNKGEVVWVIKYEKPSIAAQIFYLKNRKYEYWNDRKEVKHDITTDNKNVEFIAEWGKDETK